MTALRESTRPVGTGQLANLTELEPERLGLLDEAHLRDRIGAIQPESAWTATRFDEQSQPFVVAQRIGCQLGRRRELADSIRRCCGAAHSFCTVHGLSMHPGVDSRVKPSSGVHQAPTWPTPGSTADPCDFRHIRRENIVDWDSSPAWTGGNSRDDTGPDRGAPRSFSSSASADGLPRSAVTVPITTQHRETWILRVSWVGGRALTEVVQGIRGGDYASVPTAPAASDARPLRARFRRLASHPSATGARQAGSCGLPH